MFQAGGLGLCGVGSAACQGGGDGGEDGDEARVRDGGGGVFVVSEAVGAGGEGEGGEGEGDGGDDEEGEEGEGEEGEGERWRCGGERGGREGEIGDYCGEGGG